MSDELEVQEAVIERVQRPSEETLESLLPEIREYILWLEKREGLLADELEAGAVEARGICLFDVFGGVTAPDGSRHEVKFMLTQRSSVSSLHAFSLAFSSAQRIKGEYHMTPYVQSMIPISRGRTGTDGGQQTEEEPLEQAEEARSRARQSESRERAPTGETKNIGAEQWYKVSSIKLVWSQDETQKYFRVKCGKWMKFGIPAFLDSSNVPEDVVEMVNNGKWTTDQPSVQGDELIKQFADMQYVRADPTAENPMVLGFAEKPE